MLAKALSRFFGLCEFDRLYERTCERKGDRTFARAAVDELRLGVDLPPAHRGRIPVDGPLVVVANHPTGAMEGLVLPAVLDSVRADVKTLSHVWFRRSPELARGMFLIDPAATGRARAAGRIVLGGAVRWVREGGSLVVFPAGEVARFDWQRGEVADPAWRSGVARIVRTARATVLPVYVEARNGLFFHLLSLIHRRLGVVWLIRELLRKRETTMRVRVGRPIPYDELAGMTNDDEMTARIRRAVEFLRLREIGRPKAGVALGGCVSAIRPGHEVSR